MAPNRIARVQYLVSVLAVCGNAWANPDEIPMLTCFADKSVITKKDTARIRAFAGSDGWSYQWYADQGEFTQKSAADVQWAPPGIGRYSVSVALQQNDLESESCEVDIVVQEGTLAPSHDTAHLFLEKTVNEAPGFAVYSYVLFWHPVRSPTRQQYEQFMEAVINTIPEITEVETSYLPDELNITYVPVKEAAPKHPDAAWAVQQFDIGRSRKILQRLGAGYREGPYIVSFADAPGIDNSAADVVIQDFTGISPNLQAPLIEAYVKQMTQEHDWGETTMEQMGLRLRNTASHFATGVKVARDEVAAWIKWIRLVD